MFLFLGVIADQFSSGKPIIMFMSMFTSVIQHMRHRCPESSQYYLYICVVFVGTGQKGPKGFMHSVIKEAWFIATLIGTIGGTLWFALCAFSICIYRRRKAKKKLRSNGCVNGMYTLVVFYCRYYLKT